MQTQSTTIIQQDSPSYIVLFLLLTIGSLLLFWHSFAQDAEAAVYGGSVMAFEATLNGSNEVPPISSSASGRAILALEGNNTLYYRLMVSDIDNITAAHIHMGEAGSNGGVVFSLFDGTGTFDPDNPISGSLESELRAA